ncbi:DUF6249 domain-containing protein [uncultured Umboniibacter sp.]|uniref:DUF6249 domain-containing protein n=1 Tax=uncultured Umboniibacter sp. TaxID=1798917 RepID=UPI002609D9A8|nr:DUF6249 domain-containing protein [uncultured Umboniibacter sp.]
MTNALLKHLAIAGLAGAVSFPAMAKAPISITFVTDEIVEGKQSKESEAETEFDAESELELEVIEERAPTVEFIIDDGSGEGKRAISFTVSDHEGSERVVMVNEDGEEIEISRSEVIRERVDELRTRIEEGESLTRELKTREFETEIEMAMRELELAGTEAESLDPEQFHSWLVVREQQKSEEYFWTEVLIPITAIISVFGMPVFIVALVSYFRFRRRREVTHTIGDIVAKNPTLDNERLEEIKGLLSDTPAATKSARAVDRDLRRGAILTAIGAGILIYQLFNWKFDSLIIALVPLFIGIAYLWLHKISPKSAEQV